MQTTIYFSAEDESVFLQLQFNKNEQTSTEIEIEASVQSDLNISDTKRFKELLIELSKCLTIPEKSTSLENI